MKVIALDFGSKRVGLASTDDSGSFALPRQVLPNDECLLDAVLEFAAANKIERIVLGESNNLNGQPNPVMESILAFKTALEERGADVVLHSEVFTTQEAMRLQGENGMLDASAAALILKNYLETVARS